MENVTSNTNPLTCPFCESAHLEDFGRNSARCRTCGGVLGGELLEMLRAIVALPDTLGRHACECGHPEMRLLPDDVYRCPACGAEVVPVSAGSPTWKSPDRSEAYWSGWLDGRYGELKLMSANRGLARWESGQDRLDFYRGHRDGHEARVARRGLIEAQ